MFPHPYILIPLMFFPNPNPNPNPRVSEITRGSWNIGLLEHGVIGKKGYRKIGMSEHRAVNINIHIGNHEAREKQF